MSISIALIREARLSEREQCAKIAEAHKGSADRNLRKNGGYKGMSEEVLDEVRAEQRGEDIAAEMIAAAIRKLV